MAEALAALAALGLPRAQRNDRSALCLLALLALTPGRPWSGASNPLVGITPMMDFARDHYGRRYAPNSRETFRRFAMHQLVEDGLALYNPDRPERPVNSPAAVYQVSPEALALLRTFGGPRWPAALAEYLEIRPGLASRYARAREQALVPVRVAEGASVALSPGDHSRLIKAVVKEFAPRFVPGGRLLYAGDTGDKWGYADAERLAALGVEVGSRGKMPDVILLDEARGWLLLVEAVTSHGPVDEKRRDELRRAFAGRGHGLVFVTAFPTRAAFARYAPSVAWETEAWVAEAPSHLVHFDGERFLGPYER